jgi:5-formyltetrahydrofolate cyclo-ligase
MTPYSTSHDKDFFRTRCKQQRAMLDTEEQQHAAQAIISHLLAWDGLTSIQHIAGYHAIRDELSLLPLLTALHERGKQLYLPCTHRQDKNLTFHAWNPSQPLLMGTFGIAQPAPSSPSIIPELVLLPLLACDAQGVRLGYGGGYYDRTLAAIHAQDKHPLLIGVGYDFQYTPSLPRTSHDVTLHTMLTPERIIWF